MPPREHGGMADAAMLLLQRKRSAKNAKLQAAAEAKALKEGKPPPATRKSRRSKWRTARIIMGQKADGYTRVRRALLKDPINRTEQDVNTLMTKLDKMHIKFWAKLAHNVKRLLCKPVGIMQSPCSD